MCRLPSSSLLVILLVFSVPMPSFAKEYTCTIKTISELNANGYFVTHGWAANYLNREFTVEGNTGKVTKTTALKQRLNNFNKNSAPTIISNAGENEPLRVFTHFQDKGNYALLEIQDIAENNGSLKPFFYHTDVGMLLGGTCTIKPINNDN